ncbi:MAG: hypothetical protein ACLP5H_33090 [Desulfomonilaceae bacterium]
MKKQICSLVFLSLSCFWLTNLLTPDFALAQSPDTKNSILLTIFLKHDQSKTLEEINKHLDNTGFWKEFPPEGTEVVSWYVMMGIGQVITLRVPAAKLQEVNLAIEKRAWGAYRSEFYATYDFKPVWQSTYRKK